MIDHATVQAQRDPSSRASSLCVRGPYYEYNVRGYAVLPLVDMRSLGLLCHAVSHQYHRQISVGSASDQSARGLAAWDQPGGSWRLSAPGRLPESRSTIYRETWPHQHFRATCS